MKKILLAVVLMLLAAGGAAAWKTGLADLLKEEPVPLDELESRFVPVPRLIVPVMHDGVLRENLALSVELEVAGDQGKLEAENRLPILTDALLSELYGVVALKYVLERQDGVDIMRERLTQAAEEVLGEAMLREVLLTGINRRPVSHRAARGG